jgi:hypothetical protein
MPEKPCDAGGNAPSKSLIGAEVFALSEPNCFGRPLEHRPPGLHNTGILPSRLPAGRLIAPESICHPPPGPWASG